MWVVCMPPLRYSYHRITNQMQLTQQTNLQVYIHVIISHTVLPYPLNICIGMYNISIVIMDMIILYCTTIILNPKALVSSL